MFSYTSAISKKWLAIVFHDLKLGNIRNPFGHFFGHSSAISAISAMPFCHPSAILPPLLPCLFATSAMLWKNMLQLRSLQAVPRTGYIEAKTETQKSRCSIVI